VSGTNLFAGTYLAGVWRRPLSDFGASSVDLKDAMPIAIELSPNPTSGIVTIRGAEEGKVHVTITNLIGQRVMEITHTQPSEFQIDLSKFPNGAYLATFVHAGSVTTKIIIKD